MSQELSEQASTTEALADCEKVSQLILAHQASLDAWYRQWLLAHELYVSQLWSSRQAARQTAPT